MRGLIGFLIFVAILMFAIGEMRGWEVGFLSQTPVYFYKSSATLSQSRRTVNLGEFPVQLQGRVRTGRVVIEGSYERTQSFQNQGQPTLAERVLFRQEFTAGQVIRVNETMRAGQGIYRVRVILHDASGEVRLTLPPAGML